MIKPSIRRTPMKPPRQFTFLDEIDAMPHEVDFHASLDDGIGPFRAEGKPHRREGGCTTVYYQRTQLVGLSVSFRDDFNRTCLICIDLRESTP